MIIITSRIPKELKKSRSLSKLIQGYLYSHLPECEHDGYVHSEPRKISKEQILIFLLMKKIFKLDLRHLILSLRKE